MSILEKRRKELNEWLTEYKIGLEAAERFIQVLEKHKHYKTFNNLVVKKFKEANPEFNCVLGEYQSIAFYKYRDNYCLGEYKTYGLERVIDSLTAITYFTELVAKLTGNIADVERDLANIDADYNEMVSIRDQLKKLGEKQNAFSGRYHDAYRKLG